MKFAAGVTTALLAMGSASAFTPSQAARASSSLSSTAAEPVYTFTKSEEIFAEAQEVRTGTNELMEGLDGRLQKHVETTS